MRLTRLLSMTPAELAWRSREEAMKWRDRRAALARPRRPAAPRPRGAQAAARRLARFRAAAPARFFAGAADAATPALLRARWPEACDRVVARADAHLAGRFDLLGYEGLSFGAPVDWHLDPLAGRRAPREHWSRLRPLDPEQVGDSKVVWELNRHQWWVTLAQAHRLTGEARYADAVAAHARAWLAANPTGIGINWASSLELALRLVAWSWTLCLLRDAPALTPALFDAMLDAVEAQATHVERYLSRYFSPNTHLTGEALGLFYAGVLFRELPRARAWRARGARLLVAESRRQVLPDGVHFELSTCYHRYTLEIYLHFLLLAARHGEPVPATVAESVGRLTDFLVAIRRPDGALPDLGDADGGWLLPLVPREAPDPRGALAVAGALLRRPDAGWAAGGATPEVAWLLGAEGVAALDATPLAPPRATSRVFADAGYVVMRDGWQPDGHHLVLDAGPLGCAVSGGHGHADLLSVQCAAFGEPYLVDAGTGRYTGEWRAFFRSTRAHSTVTIDGADQAEPAGPFAWRSRPAATLRHWRAADGVEVAMAEHRAYAGLPDPVVHRREVVFAHRRFWVLIDDLEGRDEHLVELRFQFAPLAVALEPAGLARARGRDGHALLVRAHARVPLAARLCAGASAPPEGWLSPAYGRRVPAPMLVYAARARLPLRLITVLVPSRDPDAALPPTAALLRDAGLADRAAGEEGR